MNVKQFIEELNRKGLTITEEQISLFNQYFELLVDYNEKVNLTSITNKEDVYLKHFYDSVTILSEYGLPSNSKICDVGGGAGFPSVPLKIMRPDLEITIIDSLGKRIDFLNYIFEKLGLNHIYAIHTRAEDYAERYRETFDFATARAVARLNVLSELCIPLIKLNGEFIALKGSSGPEEENEAKQAIEKLGCKVKKNITFTLPLNGGDRSIIICKKIKSTPSKYPRNYGQIKKKPL